MNAVLLSDAVVGRGSTVAAGSVVAKYCMAGRAPAKPIKFKWTIDEIFGHERILYPQRGSFTCEQLETNFAEAILGK